MSFFAVDCAFFFFFLSALRVACFFFALLAGFCVFFLMFLFVVGLFFLRQFFFIVDVRFYIFSVVECCLLRFVFFLSGGRFFNGSESELRRDGVAVFVGPCAFCLFFVWCVPAFYFGFCIAGLVWRCFCTRQLNRPCFFFIMVH